MPPLDHFKVLWVYQTVEDIKGFPVEAGQKPSLCFKSRKWMVCVGAGHPVRVLKRPAKDFETLRPVFYGAGEYPVTKAIETLREIAGRNGITKGAQLILDKAAGAAEVELDE